MSQTIENAVASKQLSVKSTSLMTDNIDVDVITKKSINLLKYKYEIYLVSLWLDTAYIWSMTANCTYWYLIFIQT